MSYNVHGSVGEPIKSTPEREGVRPRSHFWEKEHKHRYILPSERRDAVRRVIASEDPDIVVLLESHIRKREKEVDRSYARLFSYPYAHHSSGYWGVTVLSRFPFLEAGEVGLGKRFATLDIPSRTVARVTVDVEGNPLCVDGVHLDVGWTEKRKAELLLKTLRTDRPWVLIGDYNARSDRDTISLSEREELTGQLKAKGLDVLAKAFARPELIPALREAGMRDAFEGLPADATCPTRTWSPDAVRTRIDHAFVSSFVNVVGGRVVRTEDTEIASDHYPITLDIEI